MYNGCSCDVHSGGGSIMDNTLLQTIAQQMIALQLQLLKDVITSDNVKSASKEYICGSNRLLKTFSIFWWERAILSSLVKDIELRNQKEGISDTITFGYRRIGTPDTNLKRGIFSITPSTRFN